MSTIWIDFENTPHVPFFAPIVRELRARGHDVQLTARDFAQTVALLEKSGLVAPIIGGEYGSSTIKKTFGLLKRAWRLAWQMKGKRIDLAVGHGSRGLLLASRMIGVPALTLYDYEGASVTLFNRLSLRVMTPDVIPFATLKRLGLKKQKHLHYPGLKEEVYTAELKPNDQIAQELRLDSNKVIITVRPPSATAHYRSDESTRLFTEIMGLLLQREGVTVVLMPRNRDQSNALQKYASASNVRIPERAVDGLSLIYHSDLVIGGGGTMNREAAAIGVPVVSIFKGPAGAVDSALVAQGKMFEIDRADEVLAYLKKRDRHSEAQIKSSTRQTIVDAIELLSEK